VLPGSPLRNYEECQPHTIVAVPVYLLDPPAGQLLVHQLPNHGNPGADAGYFAFWEQLLRTPLRP